jgi:dTDP-4-amino-4,6-dideoxygalactose transaminase
VSAAIAVEQLPHLQGYADARISKLAKLSDALELLPGISPPVTRPGMTRGAYFGYRPFFNSGELKGIGIGEFVDCLRAEGMEVRQSSNPPLHKLPLFVDNYEYLADYSLPAAEAFFATTLSLPTFTFEPDSLIDEYISAFDKVCTYFAGEG